MKDESNVKSHQAVLRERLPLGPTRGRLARRGQDPGEEGKEGVQRGWDRSGGNEKQELEETFVWYIIYVRDSIILTTTCILMICFIMPLSFLAGSKCAI